MTISIPTLPPDSPPSGPNAANAANAVNAASTDAATATPADGFAQFMSAETTPAADSAEPTAKADQPAMDQAAALAASLLWAPLPLLVETPPPTPAAGLSLDPAAGPSQETGAEPMTPAPVMAASTAFAPVQPQAAQSAAKGPGPEVPVPAMPTDPATVTPTNDPTALPQVEKTPEQPAAAPADASDKTAVAVVESGSVAPAEVPAALKADRPIAPRRFSGSIGREEKIADRLSLLDRDLSPKGITLSKTFVSATQQEVRGEEGMVGTDVAKSGPDMPFAFAAHHSPAGSPVSPAVAGSDGQPATFDLSAATEPVQQARDTVATVMSVIDAQEKPATAATRTVNLDFNFGEERLAVRVEFRDGTVHAHFRTQSLELRAALAQEWSHVAAAPENVLRLAEPVFVTSSRAEQSASFNADGGAARQQAQQEQASAFGFSSRPASAGFRSAPAADLPEAPRLRPLSTALHLQAVA